jgi:hypothetical protein
MAKNKGSPFGMNITTTNLATGCVTKAKLAADDEVASTFWLGPVTHDFGSSASAVATKLTDAAPCKLEVLSVLATVIEAKAGGTADDATKLAKEGTGTPAMTGTITCDMSDTVYSNKIGSVVGAVGVGTTDAQVAEGADIYIYSEAATSRTAGQYSVVALCKKIS